MLDRSSLTGEFIWALQNSDIDVVTYPNEGISQSLFTAQVTPVVTGGISGLIVGAIWGIKWGITVGLLLD